MAFECRVVTPDKTFFDGEVQSVVVPGWDGELGIHPKHAPLIAKLGHGELRALLPDGAVERFAVYGGFVMVRDDDVTVLASGALAAGDIDHTQALEELGDARKAHLERRPPFVSDGEFAEVEEALGRAAARERASRS